MWLAAFSSNSVLRNRRPLFEIGEECGTSATSPSRDAPSSVVEHPCAARPRRFARRDSNDAAALEADGDVLDQRALIGERLGRAHEALDARQCGVVNTSSVGMLGLQMMPFFAVDAPPSHRWSSARPTLRSVPRPGSAGASRRLSFR